MYDGPATTVDRDGRRLPDQVTMGLLPYLTAHALDEDYAQAAERRASRTETGGRGRIGWAGALVLLVFAVLAATAAVQTSRNSATEERARQALIEQVTARKASVESDRRTIDRLRSENARLESELLRNTESSGGVLARLTLLGSSSGTSAVRGPLHAGVA